MEKGLIVFLLLFALLIMAGIAQASQDDITPTVAQAQADIAIGAEPMQAIWKGMSLIVKLFLGATIAGIAAASFSEAKKAYTAWKRNSMNRQWQAGPGAQWQKQSAPQTPRITRNDLLLLALSGRIPPGELLNKPRLGKTRVESNPDELPLEF